MGKRRAFSLKHAGWIFLFGLCGCVAAPTFFLWPPKSDQTRYQIDVIAKRLHTSILIYPAPGEQSPLYREYGFAEKSWYLEERQGALGAMRAIFWPTDSVVEVRNSRRAYPINDIVNIDRRWRYSVTKEGRDAMIQFLESWYDPHNLLDASGETEYYAGRHSYHLFRGCHQYTAGALRAAGLPVRPQWAISQNLLARQLDRAEKIQNQNSF